ncbi:glycosyltransferase family 39 protein [Patescibacteria group bacterium]|nr:glycosyltransferase family 39 protein [Patescibacteria group bacterium]MBU1457537.1 glycosyltransferase family 39 protein [Patescibacteria group bacterium]
MIKKHLAFFLILVMALMVRLYKIDSPVADWHSWRQADTASVTRVFSQEGVNLFIPRYQDISNIPSGLENPNGYRMVEFPLYNLMHLGVFRLGNLNLETAGRLTSVILSLISLTFIYLIANKISGKKTALYSSIFFALLPFNIFYSRVILPEPLMITLFLASFFLAIQSKLLFSAIFFSLALLVKPYAVFFILPYLLLINKNNFKKFIIYGILALTPFILWRSWISHFPAGIPASDWLFNQNGIRFRPAWFRWLFAERLGKLILGYWGSIFLVLGLLKKPIKTLNWSYALFAVGILAYFSVLASGNITHDYYQSITMPFISLLLGRGVATLTSLPKTLFSRPLLWATAIVIFILSSAFSWYEIKGLYQINNPSIIVAGQAVDKLLPKDARVIAPYMGDTAFLYQTNRYGWPLLTHDIDQMVSLGATHYVSVNFDTDTNKLMQNPNFEVLEKTDQFVILKL